MKSSTLIVCLFVGMILTGCDESIYPNIKYSTTLDQVQAITTDMRLPKNDPDRETLEVIPSGQICARVDQYNLLANAALSCEKELKKLRKSCKDKDQD